MHSNSKKILIVGTRLGMSFRQIALTAQLACHAATEFNRIQHELDTAKIANNKPHHARKNRGFNGYNR